MNQDEINDTMAALLANQQGAQDEMKRALEKVQQNPQDPNDLLRLQQAMQNWSMTMQLQSNIIKELDDALKGIVGKMR